MVISLGGFRKAPGIRNAASLIFHPEYCRDGVRPDDLTPTPQQCAAVLMHVLCEPEFGDGSMVETKLVGSKDDNSVSVRERMILTVLPSATSARFSQVLQPIALRGDLFGKHILECLGRQHLHRGYGFKRIRRRA
ncbi:hypothetical protein CPAR01_12352 [Colletotrichum paranaense]|uniref:Uncharacterized protein n=1 Tax=Colletotrichum paranaense TaxID=1914294 RepID=A0ABQ9S663_9PEZI|nr:uncharacterized protein CPAR01_12352 [Colletotrichum paranaense]KAK1527794.1 hypothetical protein CPAR01_12352 [Colletotrichum paranaense]